MNYPLITEYIEAIKSAEDNLNKLANLHPVLDENGEPVFSSGNFAVVFKMEDEQTGKLFALKCFLKEKEGREEAYRLIEEELENVNSPFLTPIKYIENELFVDANATDETEFPVLLMDWIEGITLDKYIHNNIENKKRLRLLSLQFQSLAIWLVSQPFAHGDLKPDNILVRNDGSLVLVDYDGMYVPAMKGQKARELGSPDFRHPQRNENNFDEHIDDFPLAVITLSILIIQYDRNMYDEYAINNGVIFHEPDFMNLSESKVNSEVLSQLVKSTKLANVYSLFLMAFSKRPITKQTIESVLDTTAEKTKNNIQFYEADILCNEGDAPENDLKKAYILFKELFDKQYEDGAVCYACCLRHGYGCDKNESLAMEVMVALANKGNLRAQYGVGLCYEDGLGVVQDYQKALDWYTRSAELDNSKAQYRLGVLYEFGRGTTQDYQTAVEWYTKSAEQEHSKAQYRLGICYKYGRGVTQDYQKAIEWFTKSAEQGESNAQFALGQCCEFGEGTSQDYKAAAEWYTKAAEQKHSRAQYCLGICYKYGRGVTQDYQKAIEWFTKSAEQGESNAQFALGQCYEFGQGISKDYNAAAEWYTKAAEQKHSRAQYRLGVCYYHGNGVIQDYQKTVELFTISALQGDSVAQSNLGLLYKNGTGVSQDYQEAVGWFIKSANQGNSDAQLELGICYYYGNGVIQDYQKAVEWLTKSAEQGNPIAQRNLGALFENGSGVSKDYQKAIKWYTKSAEQGDDKSKQALERLNNINDNTTNVICGTFTDPRDGYTYKTIKIGKQIWFAENLRYLPKINDGYNVYDYHGSDLFIARRFKNFIEYGALYDHSAALAACPQGWHIPSDEEWNELEKYLGSISEGEIRNVFYTDVMAVPHSGNCGSKLVNNTSLWKNGELINNINNPIGFSALPGGWRTYHGKYENIRENAFWWTATMEDKPGAFYIYRSICFKDKGIGRKNAHKSCCFSVRCVKNK